jgi:Probable molybdopterin binding domain
MLIDEPVSQQSCPITAKSLRVAILIFMLMFVYIVLLLMVQVQAFDVVITSGGVGPTHDDITIYAVASGEHHIQHYY